VRASPGEELSLGTKIIYGAPGFASAALQIPILVLLPKFYSDVVLVPLAYIAAGIALARAFDALTDTFMGFLSDRTRTRWGRRRPWMAVGAPLCAVSIVALFMPPESLAPRDAAIWFTVTFMLYFLFHTVYLIPHAALGPELTLDYHERSSLFAWREGFTMLGLLGVLAAMGLLAWLDFGERASLAIVAIAFGSLLVLLFGLLVVGVRERADFMTRESNPVVPGVRRSLRNRPFLILLVVYVIWSIPGALPATLMPYYTEYVLQTERPLLWMVIYLGAYFASGIAFLPAWLWAARRWGKRAVWLASFWIGITGGPLVSLLGPGNVWPFLLLIAYLGSGFGAGQFLNPSIQADVIDYDELHTGKRREAQYMAFWAMGAKFVAVPSAALPLAVLGALGYVPNQPQSPEVRLAIASLIGFVPAIFSVIAFFVALRFPITERGHRAILAGVDQHKRGQAATDPVTGTLLAPPSGRRVSEETGWFLDHFSPRELRRALRGGPAPLLPRTLGMMGLSLGVCAGASWWAVEHLGGAEREPSAWLTASVLTAGFSLAAVAFHLLRARAALRLRRNPVAPDTLARHLTASGFVDAGAGSAETGTGPEIAARPE
jgi:GPH family glycoside/pentoside/hexuronide:cation symporter